MRELGKFTELASIEVLRDPNRIRALWTPEGGPDALDINPTSRCQLGCKCWSEDHTLKDGLTTRQWVDTLGFFSEGGLQSVTITGGEPLLREDVPDILQGAKDLGIHTTLSTNTLLLPKKADEVLPLVDEVGIPIDGSTPELHQRSRPGRAGADSFTTAMQSLQMLKNKYPNVDLTVRTVVSRTNVDDVPRIADVLEETLGDHPYRWKLYMLTRAGFYSGQLESNDPLFIPYKEYAAIFSNVQAEHPNIHLAPQYTPEVRGGRYVIVGTKGRVWGVGADGISEVNAGNILFTPPAKLIPAIKSLVNPQRNKLHT